MSSGEAELDVDVAAGGVGVGAELVGGVEELAGGRLVDAVDFRLDGGLEAEALVAADDADVDGDGGVGEGDFGEAGGGLEGAVEAGGVAGGEEFLGVGQGAAGAAHLLGDGEVEVEDAVDGTDVAVAAVAGGGGGGGVDGFDGWHGGAFQMREVAAEARTRLSRWCSWVASSRVRSTAQARRSGRSAIWCWSSAAAAVGRIVTVRSSWVPRSRVTRPCASRRLS